jgi:hypothetical protein
MANGQIGIVTDDTVKTKEIILNGVYEASPEMELAESSEVSNFESSSIHKQPTDRIKY